MWLRLVRPDVLFTIATIQALSPYVFWQFGVGEYKGQAGLNYMPVVIWACGWIGFMAGTLLVRSRRPERPAYVVTVSDSTLRFFTVITILVICAQLVSLSHLYGGVPILSYLRQDGAINIGTAVALQEESGMGQVGSVYVTTAVLHGLVLLLIIRNLEQKQRSQLLILLSFVVLLCAHAINGKRQGFVRGAMFLFTGLTVYAGNPIQALARATRLVRSVAVARTALIAVACLLFLSVGYLAYVRNQGRYQRSSLEELIAYQEFSLVNFELQCGPAGFGPSRVDYTLWLRRLVPWKLMDAIGLGDTQMPTRYEPWAPAGIYEDIQWSLGLPGVIVYAFLLGVGTMWCYRGVLLSPFRLLAYCQISFSLMLAHSFNEFVSLSWIPAPLLLFAMICSFLAKIRLHAEVLPVDASARSVQHA
jgi:oligosaccharide repeat unit polymerase